ncbi:MAG: amidoligase family protein [Bacilli bacterium]
MEAIYEFINKNGCDSLKIFKEVDLDNFLMLLKQIKIKYKDNLNIPLNLTFGCEIEFELADYKQVKEALETLIKKNKVQNWLLEKEEFVTKTDLTGVYGGEIDSPILNNTKDNWLELKAVCEMLKENKALALNECGAHIHVGTQILESPKAWLNFIKLWIIYEKIIYRFSYGLNELPRTKIDFYAHPIGNSLFRSLKDIKYEQDLKIILNNICFQMPVGLNFNNASIYPKDKNTIEIRCPNGTIEPIIWQNNINFFIKLLMYANNPNFDNDIIDYHLKKYTTSQNVLSKFNQVYYDEALELSDLIFDNNLDKLYFLRQYFKGDKQFILK